MTTEITRAPQPIPIPGSATTIFGDNLGAGKVIGGTEFSLRRRRRGTEIWFHSPQSNTFAFSWNVSVHENVWLRSFAEARKWVTAYAARFGQVVPEVTRRQLIARANRRAELNTQASRHARALKRRAAFKVIS